MMSLLRGDMNAGFSLLTLLLGLDPIVLAKDVNRRIGIYTHGSSRSSAEIFLVEFEDHACFALHKIDSELG